MIHRMWINQPSELQVYHAYHGKNVLAEEENETTMRVYFLEGNIISMQMDRNALSMGWIGMVKKELKNSHQRNVKSRLQML